MNTVTHWEKKFFYTTTIAIIPRAVVPELDNVIANLELMPLRMNESKNAKIGQRQRDMARKFYEAGLLSGKGLEAVLR